MMKKMLTAFTAALLLCVSMTGCGGGTEAASGQQPASSQTEAAQPATPAEEAVSGTISLYTSQPDADAAALVEAFNKVYPDIQVEVFRSGTEEVISKVYAEKQGGKIMADLLLVADNVTFEMLKQDDMLLAYTSPELENIDPAYVDPDHMFYGTKAIASVMIYNSNLAEMVPADWGDLLDSAATGQVSMASPLYSGAAAYQLSVLVRNDGLGWDYYQGLKDNNVKVGTGNGGVITDVVSGEKAYGLAIDYMANNSKKEGNPIDFAYPASGSVVVTEPISILNTTENPEAAKLFVDFVLSKEGQELASGMGYVPLHKDVASPEGLRDLSEIGQLTGDVQTLYENRESDKEAFSQMFGE